MTASNLQERLFQRIREKLPASLSLADEIADKLFISTDSAYRRIRGETLLVLDEAKTLCEIFHISLDDLLKEDSSAISFHPVQVAYEENSFEKYLQGILSRLEALSQANDKQIIYLTKDLPFFYNFLFHPLSDFHYFFWMKSILQHPDFLKASYIKDIMPLHIKKLGTEILSFYTNIPSVEIWNTECVNSTISQIEYYRDAGYFLSEDDVDELYKALEKSIYHIKLQAEYGSKFMPGQQPSLKGSNYKFFYNRLVLGDNTILVSANGKRTAFIAYEVLNYLVTENEQFGKEIHEKLHNLMKKATLLSEASDKQRSIFFNTLLKKLPARYNYQQNVE